MAERAYFHMEGNEGADYLTLLGDKRDESVVRLEVGHCCLTARVRVPIEALTLLLFDLAVSPARLRKLVRDSACPKELRNKRARKVRKIKAL